MVKLLVNSDCKMAAIEAVTRQPVKTECCHNDIDDLALLDLDKTLTENGCNDLPNTSLNELTFNGNNSDTETCDNKDECFVMNVIPNLTDTVENGDINKENKTNSVDLVGEINGDITIEVSGEGENALHEHKIVITKNARTFRKLDPRNFTLPIFGNSKSKKREKLKEANALNSENLSNKSDSPLENAESLNTGSGKLVKTPLNKIDTSVVFTDLNAKREEKNDVPKQSLLLRLFESQVNILCFTRSIFIVSFMNLFYA